VLYGDINNALRFHLFYYSLWKRYGAIPERFDYREKRPALKNYPLRPEFGESTYMLYQVLFSLKTLLHTKSTIGYSRSFLLGSRKNDPGGY
jgi:hypothetical protein